MATISSAQREGLDGWDGRGYLLNLFYFYFLSAPGIYFYLSGTTVFFTGETNSPLSFLEGTSGEWT